MVVYRDPALDEMHRASREWKKITGVRLEDEQIWTVERLRGQQAAAAKTTEAAKEERKRAQDAAKKSTDVAKDGLKTAQQAQEEKWAWERQVEESERSNAEKARGISEKKSVDAMKLQADIIRTEEAYRQREAKAAKEREKTAGDKNASAQASLAGVQAEDPMARLEAQHQKELSEYEGFKAAQAAIDEKYRILKERAKQEEFQRTAGATQQMFAGLAALTAQANMKDRSNRLRWKAMAIAEAGINMGRGIMQVIGDRSLPTIAKIPAAIGIGAFGLAQINQIKDQQFARGTDYAPGGMALVGEEGPEIMYVPRGAQIKTARETQQIMQGGGSRIDVGGINITLTGSATQADANRVGEAVDARLRSLARDIDTIQKRRIQP
jgi:hypothetical protein